MENDDESHDEANYASKPGHLRSSGVKNEMTSNLFQFEVRVEAAELDLATKIENCLRSISTPLF